MENTKQSIKLNILAILTPLVAASLVILFSCLSADKNLTGKNIGCDKITQYNASICCLQFMSSKTGSDSKDSVCRPLIDELRTRLAQERKKEFLEYCLGVERIKNQRCLDLINPR